MLRNSKKQARTDDGEIIEHVAPLPWTQPAPPAEYMIFQPTPAHPKNQTEEMEEVATPQAKPEVNEKTWVSVHHPTC